MSDILKYKTKTSDLLQRQFEKGINKDIAPHIREHFDISISPITREQHYLQDVYENSGTRKYLAEILSDLSSSEREVDLFVQKICKESRLLEELAIASTPTLFDARKAFEKRKKQFPSQSLSDDLLGTLFLTVYVMDSHVGTVCRFMQDLQRRRETFSAIPKKEYQQKKEEMERRLLPFFYAQIKRLQETLEKDQTYQEVRHQLMGRLDDSKELREAIEEGQNDEIQRFDAAGNIITTYTIVPLLETTFKQAVYLLVNTSFKEDPVKIFLDASEQIEALGNYVQRKNHYGVLLPNYLHRWGDLEELCKQG